MPIEAELKALVRDVPAVRAALADRAEARPAIYRDTYFDRAADTFIATGRELRVRTIETESGAQHLVTYKGPVVDEASQSKPEHETTVSDRRAVEAILRGLGFDVAISFTKHCENYSITHDGYQILATLVTVPELQGTFLEVETVVESAADLKPALRTVHDVLADLGLGPADLTTELYTDAVANAAATSDPAGIGGRAAPRWPHDPRIG